MFSKPGESTETSAQLCLVNRVDRLVWALNSNDLVPGGAYHKQSCPRTKECAIRCNGIVATATQVCETFVHGAAKRHSACK